MNIPEHMKQYDWYLQHLAWRGADVDAKPKRANLRGANLSAANLRGANLSDADLSDAYLSDADLSDAYLRGANLSAANLSAANLSAANLRGANLSDADLSDADLSDADLSGAYLSGANLSGAYLKNVKASHLTSFFYLSCPESGAFDAYKKCDNGVIVKLRVPAKAKRSSATSRKCRAEYVMVLAVYGAEYGVSMHDSDVIYRKGEIVHCDEWDDNRWNECSGGIHFFMTHAEAEAW